MQGESYRKFLFLVITSDLDVKDFSRCKKNVKLVQNPLALVTYSLLDCSNFDGQVIILTASLYKTLKPKRLRTVETGWDPVPRHS